MSGFVAGARRWVRESVRDKRRLGLAAMAILLLPPALLIGEAFARARLAPVGERSAVTRVYGRPLLLERGARLEAGLVEDHLRRVGYRRARGRDVGIGEYYLGDRGWIVGRRPFHEAWPGWAPDLTTGGFLVVRRDYSGRINRIEDEEGRGVSRAFLEPELIGRLASGSGADRLPVRLEDFPGELVSALLTVEDQRFFQHHGLDYRRIAAAAAANLRVGRVVQGGSTITQQLAKNLYLHPRRSLGRKLREAAMAVTLELRHSKEEILEAYLNEVYLGQDGAVGIHGVGRAAQFFFGKHPRSLTLAESAQLVALIRAPSLYSPIRNPETAVERRNLVLGLMEEGGKITEEELREASAAPLELRARPEAIRSARYFVDFATADLGGPERARAAGVAMITTMDPRLQRAAEAAVRSGLERLERDFAWLRENEAGEPLQAALVALDPASGEILAMVGGRDYGGSQFNRATDARRQPGSAFKPVVALAALSRPEEERSEEDPPDPGLRSDGPGPRGSWDFVRPAPAFTLASVLQNSPLEVETPAGLWQPANYSGDFGDPVTLRDALERSLNVPFARLGMEVGPERIVETARNLGIRSPLRPYLSLALGAGEVTPLELTQAFGVLAAGGVLTRPRALYGDPAAGPRQANGEVDSGGVGGTDGGTDGWGPQRVFDPAETFLVTSALRGAVERGTGKGIRDGGFFGDVAAKSGTTNDFRDGWFVGYTPSLVVGVWVGFDHGKRLELPGAGVALPIFVEFLKEAVGPHGDEGPWGSPGFSYPSGLEVVEVDQGTGLRAGWGCRGEAELFLQGTAPQESCSGFRFDRRTFERIVDEGGEGAIRLLRRLLGQGRGEGGGLP